MPLFPAASTLTGYVEKHVWAEGCADLKFRFACNSWLIKALESFKYASTVTYLFFERGMARLQKLGRVRALTPSKNLIVKGEQEPKIGSSVIDENLNVVGKIFDIIGPVSAPYIVVKPTVREPAKLVNKPVYLLLSKTKGSKTE
jgi:RNA-binding protein